MSDNNLNLKTKMPSLTSNDTIKKLIHSASILVKQLDAAVTKAKACKDLFTSDVIELRSQLAYLCVKSIGADPLQCRRRAEELLWKKCYYDVISYAKISGKKSLLSSTEKLFIGNHIDSGIIKFSELMQDACLRLKMMDPPIKLQLNVLPVLGGKSQNNELPKESKEELMESVQKILVWLGDLSRYRSDLEISNSVITSERFYRQAILVNPTIGLPYNQLGTLTSHNPSRGFESILYYVRSMKAMKVFPGAEPNLKALLARLIVNEDKLISSFSQLFPKLAFVGKEENTFEVSQLCQATLSEVQNRLRVNEHGTNLLDLAACVVMCTITQSSATNKNQTTAAIAFCCSLFSHVLNKFQEFFNLSCKEVTQQNGNHESNQGKDPTPEVNQKVDGESTDEDEEETKRAKLRRRKIGSGSSDQEFSEEELFLDTDSEQESEEDEEALSDSGFHSAEAKIEPLIEIPSDATSLLPAFKLLTDWFQANDQVVQVSNQSIQKMWAALAEILNVFKRCQRENVDQYRCVPLEEDWKLYGVSAMSSLHSEIDFECAPTSLNVSIMNSIRLERILLFGTWLAQKGNGFQVENGTYRCLLEEATGDKAEGMGSKADLMMRNMAHLWLKSEVQELERRLSPQPKRKKKTSFDLSNLSYVYLVPDVSALSEYTHLIKQVIKSQKFIVVIPDIVISEIDQLKKESSTVRECIRWLESCFRTGNRFVRAQRQNEHQVIPLLTYPKRKDKANWTLFQILECCHFLDTHQRNVYKTSQNSPIVLFLTGRATEEIDQHTKGICSSIGVELKSANSLMKKSKTKKR